MPAVSHFARTTHTIALHTCLPSLSQAMNEYLSKTFLHRISQAIEMYEPFAKNYPRQNQELQKGIAIIYEGIREDG